MKELHANEITGSISITYESDLGFTSEDIVADLPSDIIQAFSKYEDHEVETIIIKMLLALKMDKNRVLRAGNHILVTGDVIIKE